MNHLNRNAKLKSIKNFWGIFAFILILIVSLSCSIDLGELGGTNDKSNDKDTSEKRPSGKKEKKPKDDEEEESKNLQVINPIRVISLQNIPIFKTKNMLPLIRACVIRKF